jgi:hypothetical protein
MSDKEPLQLGGLLYSRRLKGERESMLLSLPKKYWKPPQEGKPLPLRAKGARLVGLSIALRTQAQRWLSVPLGLQVGALVV